jgi:hypothetical protein
MFTELSLPPDIFIFTPFGVIYPGSPTPALDNLICHFCLEMQIESIKEREH